MSSIKSLVAEMNIQAVAYTAETKTHHIKTSQYKGEWTVIRWPLGEVQIPPRTEILTPDGWCNILKAHAALQKFNHALDAIVAAVE